MDGHNEEKGVEYGLDGGAYDGVHDVVVVGNDAARTQRQFGADGRATDSPAASVTPEAAAHGSSTAHGLEAAVREREREEQKRLHVETRWALDVERVPAADVRGTWDTTVLQLYLSARPKQFHMLGMYA